MKRFILLLLISISSLNAQNEALDYMVTTKNDTIFGSIQKTQIIHYSNNKIYFLKHVVKLDRLFLDRELMLLKLCLN